MPKARVNVPAPEVVLVEPTTLRLPSPIVDSPASAVCSADAVSPLAASADVVSPSNASENVPPVGVRYPSEFDGQVDEERAVAGTVDTVTATLRRHMAATGMNYLVGRFAFGDMAPEDSLRSVELFARHVMPALRQEAEAAE